MAHTRGQVEFRHLAWKEDKREKNSVDTNVPDSDVCFYLKFNPKLESIEIFEINASKRVTEKYNNKKRLHIVL